jgi:hypothetical protein
MMRTPALFLTTLLLGFAVCHAAENPLIGKWDCKAVATETNETTTWTLVVKEERGELTGLMIGKGSQTGAELLVVDIKVERSRFSFKVHINRNPHVIEAKITGKKFEGKYKGAEASGTITGVKQG